MSIKTILRAAAFVAVASLPSFAAHADELPPAIHFGGVGSGYGLPYGTGIFAVAQDKGFVDAEFKGTPVKISWDYLTGTGPAINEALSNAQLDFAQYGSLPSTIARANGVQTRVVLAGGSINLYAVALTALPIQTVKDLKGRRLTIQKGTIMQAALDPLLQANQLTDHDLTLLDLKLPDQFAALAAGSVDAAFGTSNLLALRDKGLVKLIYSSHDAGPAASGIETTVVRDAFARQFPDATQRVVLGLVKAAAWINDPQNRDETFRIWAKSGISPTLIAEDYQGQPLGAEVTPVLDAFFAARLAETAAFARRERLIRRDVDVPGWLDPSFLDAALKRTGLEQTWPRRKADGTSAS